MVKGWQMEEARVACKGLGQDRSRLEVFGASCCGHRTLREVVPGLNALYSETWD